MANGVRCPDNNYETSIFHHRENVPQRPISLKLKTASSINFLLSFLYCFFVAVTTTEAAVGSKEQQKIKIHLLEQDAFVCSSPLIAAMVCKDGIALVASHVDEPLQFDHVDDQEHLPLDLPFPSYNQRIMSLGRSGSVIMTCGWRADGHGRLMDKARAIVAKNMETFGSEGIDTLPHDLALYFTSCAGSEGMRSLSCAAILATPGDVTRKPCLWLIDETGATAVRAMCLGGGYRAHENSRTTVSEQVQKELAVLLKEQIDSNGPYFDMTATAGLAVLIKILKQKELLRPHMRFELAILPSGEGKQQLQRRKIADNIEQAQ